MPVVIIPYTGAKVPDVRLTPKRVTAAGRVLASNEAVAYEIISPDRRDLWVRSRVRPFQVAGTTYNATTLLISDADGRSQPILQEPGDGE